jgi:GntR family transcriptional regulator/MocR family aminotransferase
VRNAIDQLMAEGYLEAQVGSGTYVTSQLPDATLAIWSEKEPASQSDHPPRPLSSYGETMARIGRSFPDQPLQNNHPLFAIGMPDMSLFPGKIWTRLLTRYHRRTPIRQLAQPQSMGGELALRQALVSYLRTARAVHCDAEQVFVVAGSQRSLYVTAQLLLNAGDRAWTEDPGYVGARSAILCTGGRPFPIPVDANGLDVDAGIRIAPDAKLAVVTPSHQFPLGYTMSLPRRLQLLQWADSSRRWIVEDDYDSAFRFDGPALPALQGLDKNGRVIYLGTFSKVLFPALRLAYLIVPPNLVSAYRGALVPTGSYPPLVNQMVLAEFMQEGHFARHLRRMQKRYAEKRHFLHKLVQQTMSGLLELGVAECGMHVVGWLPPGISDTAISARAQQDGYHIITVSGLSQKQTRPGILLSFTSASARQMRDGIIYLEKIIAEQMKITH